MYTAPGLEDMDLVLSSVELTSSRKELDSSQSSVAAIEGLSQCEVLLCKHSRDHTTDNFHAETLQCWESVPQT